MKDYGFKKLKLRGYNNETAKMYHSHDTSTAFVINSTGFAVLSLDKEGNIHPETLGDDTNTILMQFSGVRDKQGVEVYEGDVISFKRTVNKKIVPIMGIVVFKDFCFVVNMGERSFIFGGEDRDLEILGNIFEKTDAELAKIVEERIPKPAKEPQK